MRKAGEVAAYFIKKVWLLLAVVLVLFAVMLSVLRYALPHLDHKKHLLEEYVNEKYGVELHIGSVQADWVKEGPSVILNDVVLVNSDSSPVALEIEQVHMKIDFWESLRQRMLSSNAFTLDTLSVEIDTDRLHDAGESDFPVVDALKSLFLEQLQRFTLSDGEVVLLRNGTREVLQIDALNWLNRDEHHQGTGAIRVQELTNNSASFIIDLTGSPDNLNGVLYAKAKDLDISPWVKGLLSTHRPLQESRANFEVWAEVSSSEFSAFYTQFDESKLAWGEEDELVFNSGIRGGSIQALPVGENWHFRVDQLIFESNDQSLVTDLVGTVDSQGEMLVNTVKPAPVNPFLVLLPLFTNDTADDNVRDLNPTGQLATMQLYLTSKGVQLAAKLIDISWQQEKKIPGLDAIDADIYWYKNQGVILLSAEDASLDIDNLLPDNLNIDTLSGKVFVYSDQDEWVVESYELAVRSDKLSFSPAFHYRTGSKALLARADIAPRPLENIQALLPGPLMGKHTSAFLNRALAGSGEIAGGTILWQGRLSDFPFADNQGVFLAQVALKDATFQFSKDWLPLTHTDATLIFENRGLSITSPGGRLGDIRVGNMQARIPALTKGGELTIDAVGEGQAEAVTALMLQSSLADSLGRLLDKDIIASGTLKAALNLVIPFDDPHVVATGSVQLNGNDITVTSTGMRFSGTHGEISFVNDAISADNITADLLAQPVTLSFSGFKENSDYRVDIGLAGEWNVGPLLSQYNPDFKQYLSGSSGWQAVVDLTLQPQGFSYGANLTAPLTGINSDLPAPFAKEAEQTLLLNIISEGNQQASTVKASLGDEVRFEGVLPHEEMQFSRAHLAMGESDFVGMGIGFSISAELPYVDSADWYKTIEMLVSGISAKQGDSSKATLFSVPERIFITTDSLVIAGQQLTNARVTAKQQNNNWMLDINAAQARATVNLYDDWLARGVSVEADYLRFDKWKEKTEDQAQHQWNADTLPPVYFHCAQCSVLERDLGEVTIDVVKADSGLDIRQFRSQSKHGLITASGKWIFGKDTNHTSLEGTVKSDDVGLMLKAWGLDSGIKDSGANVEFALNWDKSPMDFDTSLVSGDVSWSLTDGYLSEVSDKGSRIFTLFSLNSLVRKLSLDFRDVFATGFFYDDMSGTLRIDKGKAFTDDTVIDGGAGDINIRGYTDLVTSELNYNVEFTPNVTGNLPILVYFLATPPTALAALALDQVLTSAKVISNVNYHVTGTLSEPVFDEVGRDSKEVSLPAQTNPVDPALEPLADPDMERIKLEINDD